MAGVVSVIRNKNGLILLSYSGPVGFYSNNKAELWALKIGLWEASALNPHRLLVEGDYACTIQWASLYSSAPWYLADIIEEVNQLSKELNISFSYIRRSANDEVDKLAKEGVYKLSLIVLRC